mmetsp:Transcript_21157/g.35339  ORF Transcript_21157/g.35339 Transcript_21157/m.35339 type:complete len:501 (+) Transcript_21157:41-1543(+)
MAYSRLSAALAFVTLLHSQVVISNAADANAIPLVSIYKSPSQEHARMNLSKDAFNVLSKLPSETVVVAFFGVMRIGKSTLARSLCKVAGYSASFPVSDVGDKGCTQGIMMLDRVVEYGGRKFLFLDMMGTDDALWDDEIITKLLAFLSLQSDVLIQNEHGSLTRTALTNLEKMVAAQQHIDFGSSKDKMKTPALIIRLRDALRLSEGNTPEKHLDVFLKTHRNVDVLKTMFQVRKLFLHAQPPQDYSSDALIEKLDEPVFAAYRKSCSELLQTTISLLADRPGRSGQEIAMAVRLTVDALNSGKVQVPTLLQRSEEVRSSLIAEMVFENFEKRLENVVLSGDDKELLSVIRPLKAKAEKSFDEKTEGFVWIGNARKSLLEKLKLKEETYLAANAREYAWQLEKEADRKIKEAIRLKEEADRLKEEADTVRVTPVPVAKDQSRDKGEHPFWGIVLGALLVVLVVNLWKPAPAPTGRGINHDLLDSPEYREILRKILDSFDR